MNAAALEIFGFEPEDMIGESFEIFIPDSHKEKHKKFVGDHFTTDAMKFVGKVVEVIGKRKDGSEFPVELRESEMALGYERNFSIIIRDITERKYAEAERENFIRNLKDALESIKTLKGMIPICASCKKIRDDKGYMQGVESYISKHMDVDFSHSICPECMHKLYPDLVEKEEIS